MIVRGHRIFMWLIFLTITTTTIITIMTTTTIITIIIIILTLNSLLFRSLLLHPFPLLLYKIPHKPSLLHLLMSEVLIIPLNSKRSYKTYSMNHFPLLVFKRLSFLSAMLN